MKNKLVFRCFTAVFLVAIGAVVIWASVPRRTVKEKLLRTVGPKIEWRGREIIISPDGAHTAWVEHTKDRHTVFRNGRPIGSYASIRDPWSDMRFAAMLPGLVFSETGGHLAYVIADGEQIRMVVDGKLGKSYDEVGRPAFSTDGKRIAYAARKDGKWFAVLAGREGKRYDGISSGLGSPVILSPNGRSVAYTANIGERKLTVINDKELPSSYSIRDNIFSRDGSHYALASSEINGIIKDGRPIPWAHHPFYLSPDGKRIAYFVGKKDGYHLMLDGKLSKPFKDRIRGAAFSPDSKRFAYALMPYHNKYNGKILVVDGKESKQMYGMISLITFSPDSKRFACNVTLNGRRRMLVDGKIIDFSGWPRTPVFSPDSKHLAFITGSSIRTDGGIVLDGKQIGKPGYEYQEPLVFSPDSKHVACIVRKDEKESVCIDGIPGKFYDNIIVNRSGDLMPQNGVFFDAPDRLHYFARRGSKVYRVDEHIF